MTRESPLGTRFRGRGRYGDYAWMVKQPKYHNSLFIFNDNEEDKATTVRGGGSACVRSYNYLGYSRMGLDKPLSVGIPTGRNGRGYRSLEEGRLGIDYAISLLEKILGLYQYDAVYFPEGADGLIGTQTFSVGQEVRSYITRRIRTARADFPRAPDDK